MQLNTVHSLPTTGLPDFGNSLNFFKHSLAIRSGSGGFFKFAIIYDRRTGLILTSISLEKNTQLNVIIVFIRIDKRHAHALAILVKIQNIHELCK